jgi:SAM-dependent methyltransferase
VPTAAARFFDAMAESYDDLEPWYEHLYAVLHTIVRTELARAGNPPGRALDAGCGTGFQTRILADLGYRVHGIDVSTGALAVAHRRQRGRAWLAAADVVALPQRGASFDVAVCCGSTLNFAGDPARALAEIARVLRPGGRLLLECEHRFSLDLGWALLGGLLGDALGYGLSARQAWRQVAASPGVGVWIDYPGYPSLRLVTRGELRAWLDGAGLTPVRTWSIHSVTNLIPSPMLHRERVGRTLAALYRALAAADRVLARSRAAQLVANHLVVLAGKR